MIFDNHTGLVLEGGALRGVFTCGVLDCFMDHDIRFPFIVGVSAGACNGLSYMSNQRGRRSDYHHPSFESCSSRTIGKGYSQTCSPI